jgi:hypothetical protein
VPRDGIGPADEGGVPGESVAVSATRCCVVREFSSTITAAAINPATSMTRPASRSRGPHGCCCIHGAAKKRTPRRGQSTDRPAPPCDRLTFRNIDRIRLGLEPRPKRLGVPRHQAAGASLIGGDGVSRIVAGRGIDQHKQVRP